MVTSTLIKTLASHSLAFATKKFAPSFSWLSHPLSGPTKNEKAPLKTFLRSSSSYKISSHEVLPPLCRVPAPPTQCCEYIFYLCSNLHLVFLVSLFGVYLHHFLHIYLFVTKDLNACHKIFQKYFFFLENNSGTCNFKHQIKKNL